MLRLILVTLFLATGCIPWRLPDVRADADADVDAAADTIDADGDADEDADVEICDPGFLPIFPGAAGYGTQTRAAYGGVTAPEICVVAEHESSDGLRRGDRSGVSVRLGSFRECVELDQDGKVIIFEISGTLEMPGDLIIDNNYVTIAGQTAPPPGIELRQSRLVIDGHDILVQHLASRYGATAPEGISEGLRDVLVVAPRSDDCAASGPYNVVIDHLSMAWAPATNIKLGHSGDARRSCTHDVTVSNTITAEGLILDGDSYHYSGGLRISGGGNIFLGWNIFHSNQRYNPGISNGQSSGLIVNNLIYNAGTESMMFQGIAFPIHFSVVGNVNRPGPSSADTRGCCVIASLYHSDGSPFNPTSRLYFEDNQCGDYSVQPEQQPSMYTQEGPDDWDVLWLDNGFDPEVLSLTPLVQEPPCVEPIPSGEVLGYVNEHAGARPAERHLVAGGVDQSLIDDIRDVEEKDGYDSPRTNWFEYEERMRNVESQMVPDGLDPFPRDPHGDDDLDGYTNLEEWIHRCSAAVE